MRVFQASSLPLDYLSSLNARFIERESFARRSRKIIEDGYGYAHLLLPVLRGDSTAFFANGNDAQSQRLWARENGLRDSVSEETILLSQIEAHRTEVFYNLDPIRYGSSFVKKLPGCVRKSLCWRAAPSPGADFAAYELVLGNFKKILEMWRHQGCRTRYFSPAWGLDFGNSFSPVNRPVDIAFVGSFSRHHRRRNEVLEALAQKKSDWKIVYCFAASRLTSLANSALAFLPIFSVFGQTKRLRSLVRPPVYGMALYDLLGSAKIVLNAHGEIAGNERGNMRCFETMGCGALLVSDRGQYPAGFVSGENYVDYTSPDEAESKIQELLNCDDGRRAITDAGANLIHSHYSKATQWAEFQEIAA